MGESHFGDAVLYESKSYSSKFIRPFIGSPYAHCALRTGRETAESIEWPSKILVHDLKDPLDEYISYKIYRPKDITPLQREGLKILNNEVGREYDINLILKLASRKILMRHPSVEDLAKENLFTCSSRMAMLYEMVGIKVLPETHFSQIVPPHFMESDNFEFVSDWSRGKKPTISRLKKILNTLPFCKSHPQIVLKRRSK